MEANPGVENFARVGFGIARALGMVEDWVTVVFAATVTVLGTLG
jgi:hypothetical protein